MKSILIPTTFEADLINAVEAAVAQSTGTNCTITLLNLKEAEDTYSAGYTLQKMGSSFTAAQRQVADKCYEAVKRAPNCRLAIHDQFGISGPLLKNLMEYLNTDLIIITRSYRAEKRKIHTYCLSLLVKSRMPILHTGEEKKPNLDNALYIEHKAAQLGVRELHRLVNGRFNMKIVSSARLDEGQSVKTLENDLLAAIEQNNIDVLIETRKPEKKKFSEFLINDSLGLPVLSIYEEPARAEV